MKKVQIKSVEIEVGKKKFNLTVEEAKKLKNVLDELFGKEIIKEVKEIHHHDGHSHPWYWNYPTVFTPTTGDPIPPRLPVFYCDNGAVEYENSALKITC